jgi:Fe-S-cluster containining protein
MGEIISIREQIDPFEFRIAYTNGEERIVSVDPDKRALFRVQQQGEKKSLACPFLRQQAPLKYICTVHASRPELCRSYLCSRILVLDRDGNKAGRVQHGTRFFTTENKVLLDLWCRSIRDVRVPEEELWEKYVEEVFVVAGYRVLK